MTALKLPLGVTFEEHVSHNAVPPWLGQGDQPPDPPFHVDVVCARAGSLTSPAKARAMTAISNRDPTDFVVSLDESIFIPLLTFIAVGLGLQTCPPNLQAQPRTATASRTAYSCRHRHPLKRQGCSRLRYL